MQTQRAISSVIAIYIKTIFKKKSDKFKQPITSRKIIHKI